MERSEHKEKKLFKRFQDQCPLRMPLYDYSYIGLKKKKGLLMIKKLVLLESFHIIWHAKITLHLIWWLSKIYKWHVLVWIDSLKYMIKVIKELKCLPITTALITLLSPCNSGLKKNHIIQYYIHQIHITKKNPSIHSF